MKGLGMPRPTVLIASTNQAMATALEGLLRQGCKELGLRLILPPTKGGNFDCADELFDYLESCDPVGLSDTLVLLDLGATRLDTAFAPRVGIQQHGWHWTENRAGVATELLLRFPQVYPLFLSLYVPARYDNDIDISLSPPSALSVDPPRGETYASNRWRCYDYLCQELRILHRIRHRGQEEAREIKLEDGAVQAFSIPLHFVSPLDVPKGILQVLRRFSTPLCLDRAA